MKRQKTIELDFNSVRTVDLYPYAVVVQVMEALKLAEQKSDMAALKWCARKILFLYEISDTSTGGISPEQAGRLFMSAYMGADVPPPSIAGIVGAIGEAE
jgi:hypothetical protein